LRVGKIVRTETDRQSPGTVIAQDPRPNAPMASGCPVDLEVAVPIPLVTVPNFVGLTEEQVRQRLPRGIIGAFSPLRLGNITYRDYSDVYRSRIGRTASVNAPTVVEQNPGANSQVRKGSEVDLVVLRPPAGGGTSDGVSVPRLQGLTLEDARRTLSGVHLVLGDVRYTSETRGIARRSVTNRITAQDPQAGSVVGPGTRINVVVDGYPPGPVIRPPEF
jgi:beta-lactam-binding protein with PASTA domain